MNDVLEQPPVLRLLDPADSLAELTRLLHLAYRPLAESGMRFVASYQDENKTRQRVSTGECWVATIGMRIIGTVTLYDASHTNGCPWLDRADVGEFGQFAVHPDFQRRGIGSRLIDHIETRARLHGTGELALNTSENATHLIQYYVKRGYRFVEHVKWDEVNYRSVVLSKRLLT